MKTLKTLFTFAVLMLGLLFAASPPVWAESMENPRNGVSNFSENKSVTILVIGADSALESNIAAALTKAHLTEGLTIISGVEESDICLEESVPLLENSQFRELIAALRSNYMEPPDNRLQFAGNRAGYSKPPDVTAFHGINVDTFARARV